VDIKDLICVDTVESVSDNSDSKMNMQRVRVYFKNGHSLSIIRGEYSYGGPEGLFEIMPSDNSFFDDEDRDGDDVLGYLTPERVSYYINKIGQMPETAQ